MPNAGQVPLWQGASDSAAVLRALASLQKRDAPASPLLKAKRSCLSKPSPELGTGLSSLRGRLDAAQCRWNRVTSKSADLELDAISGELEQLLIALLPQEGTAAEALVRITRERLIWLALQLRRAGRAQELLRDGGYLYRLSDEVLLAGEEGPLLHSWPPSGPFVAIVDAAMPQSLLRDLQTAFGPDAPFWEEHGYWKDDSFFSYEVPLAASGVHQQPRHPALEAALLVAAIAAAVQPELAASGLGYAEWWCHSKPHCAGHLLHFDQADDAQVPVVSTVLYLSQENVGGPTLVTDQGMHDPNLAAQGWLCRPKENRLLLFDGKLLHGVLPGSGGPAAATGHEDTSPRRVTLMVALCKQQPELGRREGSAMPTPADSGLAWPRLLATEPVGDVNAWATSRQPQHPSAVSVWTSVSGGAVQGPVPSPPPSQCFQGVTPWRGVPDRLLAGDAFE